MCFLLQCASSVDRTCKQSIEETSKVNYERDAQEEEKKFTSGFFDCSTHSSAID